MTWKVMTAAEVCDVMTFFESLSWPLAKSQVQRLAADRFGWRIEESRNKHYLVNTVSALSEPDVSVISNREHTLSVDMRTTDIIREVTEDSRRFLDDAFEMLVSEGETRWGAARIVRDGVLQNAMWSTPADGRIRFTGSDMDILIEYRTPQGTDLERRLSR